MLFRRTFTHFDFGATRETRRLPDSAEQEPGRTSQRISRFLAQNETSGIFLLMKVLNKVKM